MSLSGGKADVEMLEDLIVAAVNEAGRKADEAIQSSVQGIWAASSSRDWDSQRTAPGDREVSAWHAMPSPWPGSSKN